MASAPRKFIKECLTVSRRGFLGTLLGTVAGVALADLTPAQSLWFPAAPDLAPVAPGALLTLSAITRELTRQLHAKIGDRLGPIAPIGKVGDADANWPLLLTDQFCLVMAHPSEVGPSGYPLSEVEAMAELLAGEVKHRDLRHLGQLSIPHGVSQGCSHVYRNIAVRAIQGYDLEFDKQLVKFDIIGGRG